ncbi:MAG: class I SAM-dependent methyltransferase [Candidatus Saccharibacteria bacterium]|nr:class I SAM-dependent methyltransferase [Pseudorhodobacter sp.]
MPISPYHKPNFYADALARGRHRDIVGGRWDETGRAQMALLRQHGLLPHHHLLDIGAGALRLGCRAIHYLDPDHYWATDLSGDLMLRGYQTELADPTRLNPDHLVQDDNFSFAGIPDTITHAIAFAVFTHLPLSHLTHALAQIQRCFPELQFLLFTTFLAPPESYHSPLRQPDGVVTHPRRAPYHHRFDDIVTATRTSGFQAEMSDPHLPRGQRLWAAHRA